MFNYDVHKFQINVFVNDVVQDFIDQSFVVQAFCSSKQAKRFCSQNFLLFKFFKDKWYFKFMAKHYVD